MINLEQIVIAPHTDYEPEGLAEAKRLLTQLSSAKTEAEIDEEYRQKAPIAPVQVTRLTEDELNQRAPLYQKQQRGILQRKARNEDEERYQESAAKRDRVALDNIRDEARYDRELTAYYAMNKEHQADLTRARANSRESLSNSIPSLLEGVVTQPLFEFRGDDFTRLVKDEAEFLSHYFNYQQQRSQGKSDEAQIKAAYESLERMIEIANNSLAPVLTTNSPANEFGGYRNVLTLEQARILMDAGIYPRAVEVADKVDNSAVKGEASRLKVEIHLANKDLIRAGIEAVNTYATNPTIDGMDSKSEDVVGALIRNGYVDDAIKTLDGLVQYSPSFNETRKNSFLLQEARALMDSNNYERAIEIASKVDEGTSNGRSLRLIGEAYLKQGRYAEAAGTFVRAYAKNPTLEGLDSLSIDAVRALIRSGNVDDANGILENLISSSPANFNEARKNSLLLEEAKALMESANYERAIEVASKVDNTASNGEAARLRGEIYLIQKEYNKAAAEFIDAYTVNPNVNNDNKVIEVVKSQIGLGFVDAAVDTLDKIVSSATSAMSPWSEGRKSSLLLEEAQAFFDKGDYDLAVQIADKVNDGIVDGRASYLRGQIRLAQHDYNDAIKELRTALDLTSRIDGARRKDTREKIADAYFELGNLTINPNIDYKNVDAETGEQFKEAEHKHNYAFVLESKPLYEVVLSKLQAKEDTGKLNTDETAIKALTLFNLARIQRVEGNVQNAIDLLNQSLEIMPTKKAYNSLSDSYARQMK